MADLPHSAKRLAARFAQIPIAAREVWQGAIVRLPAWIDPGQSESPYRPSGAIWVSVATGRMGLEVAQSRDEQGPELLLAGLLRFGRAEKKEVGGRAGRLQVADAETKAFLEEALGSAAHVEVVPRLDVLTEAVREYTEIATEEEPAAIMDGLEVTLEVVERFAEAAAQYYTAAPWQQLTDEDLLEVEAPAAPPGYRFPLVLGKAGHTHGLGFYASREQYEAMLNADSPEEAAAHTADTLGVARSVLFDTEDGIPIKDHDLWLDRRLPLAGPSAYPFPARYHGHGETSRPSREELEFIEAVLRVLTDTTEDDMNAGRWTKTVHAGGHPITMRLSLPGLLEDIAGTASGDAAATPRVPSLPSRDSSIVEGAAAAARAAELVERAREARGRGELVLAKRALEMWPDCVDAAIIVAEKASTPEQAVSLLEPVVTAGRRTVEGRLEDVHGDPWDDPVASPYLRARVELAFALDAAAREDEAVEQLRELMALDAPDHAQVRYLLVPRLLERGQSEEAAAILAAHLDDTGVGMTYLRALQAFQAGGNSDTARHALAAAVEQNPFVPGLLLTSEELEEREDPEPGSEGEAVLLANSLIDAWAATPGAMEWLESQAAALRLHERTAGRRKKPRRRPRQA